MSGNNCRTGSNPGKKTGPHKSVGVKVPRVPNFIAVGSEYIAIANFTDNELRVIGKAWTNQLVELAKQRRPRG